MRSGPRALATLATLGVVCAAGACVDNANGTAGQQGQLRFVEVTQGLVFSRTLVAGSTFTFAVEATADDVPKAAAAHSSDDDVFTVSGAAETFTLTSTTEAPGAADIIVDDDSGDEIDRITVRTAQARQAQLFDGALLGASDQVDARTPQRFAVLRSPCNTDGDTSCVVHNLLIGAIDACGGDLLDLASTLEVTGASSQVHATGPAAFSLELRGTDLDKLTVKTPGLDDLGYDVVPVNANQVDEVQVAALGSTDNLATVWGRAFADDVELIGDLQFSWSGDERAAVQTATGIVSTVSVSFPEDGSTDDRPAVVTAEIFGETGSLDLLTATTVTSRGEAPAQPLPPSLSDGKVEGGGCGGGGTCGALLLTAPFLRLRLPRRRCR